MNTDKAPPSEREARFTTEFLKQVTELSEVLDKMRHGTGGAVAMFCQDAYEKGWQARAAVPQAAADIELCGDKYSDAFLDAPDSVHLCELPKGHENHQDATMWWKSERKANA